MIWWFRLDGVKTTEVKKKSAQLCACKRTATLQRRRASASQMLCRFVHKQIAAPPPAPLPPTSCVLNFQNICPRCVRRSYVKEGGGFRCISKRLARNHCVALSRFDHKIRLWLRHTDRLVLWVTGLHFCLKGELWTKCYFYFYYYLKSSQTFPGRPDDPSDLGNQTLKSAVMWS